MRLAVFHQLGVVEGEVLFLLISLLSLVLEGHDGIVGLFLLEQNVVLGERDVLFGGGEAPVFA